MRGLGCGFAVKSAKRIGGLVDTCAFRTASFVVGVAVVRISQALAIPGGSVEIFGQGADSLSPSARILVGLISGLSHLLFPSRVQSLSVPPTDKHDYNA